MQEITVNKLVSKLLIIPQDAVICTEIDGEYFSIEGILKFTQGEYINSVGEEKEGNLVIIK